jgi:hypothetical protein
MPNPIYSMTNASTVEIDPSSPGTIIRCAMAIEGVFNIFGATMMLLYPATLLSYAIAGVASFADNRSVKTCVTPALISMVQWLGALILGLTPQLFLSIPNTRQAIESRRLVYLTLGAGELGLAAVILWQVYGSGLEAEHVGEQLSNKTLVRIAQQMILMLGLRLYVLYCRPSLLGKYREVAKDE